MDERTRELLEQLLKAAAELSILKKILATTGNKSEGHSQDILEEASELDKLINKTTVHLKENTNV